MGSEGQVQIKVLTDVVLFTFTLWKLFSSSYRLNNLYPEEKTFPKNICTKMYATAFAGILILAWLTDPIFRIDDHRDTCTSLLDYKISEDQTFFHGVFWFTKFQIVIK